MNPTQYLHNYRGYWSDGGVCQVNWYDAAGGKPPVLVITELPSNENTSVTNMIEYLTAELLAKHYPQALYQDAPVVVIERYLRSEEEKRHGIEECWSIVEFNSLQPTKTWLGNGPRVRVGAPSWKDITEAEYDALADATRTVQGGQDVA